MTYGSIEDAVMAIKSAKACGIEEYLEKSGLGKSYAVLYDKDVYYFPKKMPLLPGYQQAGVSIAPSGTAVYYINEDTFDTARLNWTPECDKEERIQTIKSNFYDVERYEGTEFYFGHSGSDIFIHWWEGDNWFELMYPIEAGVPLAVMIENLAFIRYDMAADSREEPHEQMGSLVPCTEDNLSVEYRTALKSAEEYAASTHSSKLGTYNRLTSIYDGSYSLEAAQYAVDHASVDWKEMALARAVDNCNVFPLSKMGLFNTLFSQGGFTEEEAWYAADTIKADWCENALTQAQWYCDYHMSKTGTYNRLIYEAQFTEKEAQYAMRNLSVDWSANAVRRASDYECLYLSREAVYRQLTSEYVHFDEVEASNALYHVGVVWEEQALEVAYFLYENTDMTKDEIYERLISGNYLFLPNEAQFAIDNLDFYGCYKAG